MATRAGPISATLSADSGAWVLAKHIDYVAAATNDWLGDPTASVDSITHTLTGSGLPTTFGITNGVGLRMVEPDGADSLIDILLADLYTAPALTEYMEIWIALQFSSITGVVSAGFTSYLSMQLYQRTAAPIQIAACGLDSLVGAAESHFFELYDQGSSYLVNPRAVVGTRPLLWSIDGRVGSWRARSNSTASGNVPLTNYVDPSEIQNQFGVGGNTAGWGSMRENNVGGTTGLVTGSARLRLAVGKVAGGGATEMDWTLTKLWALYRPVPS